MDILNKKFDYSAQLLDGTEICDLSDDYTLPDYMPAVGRVISCSASVAPPSLYFGGNNFEYAGGVRYRLLYESADDKTVWCAELPAEYDVHLSSNQNVAQTDPEALSGLSYATADNITARITAPRRLTVKSRIKLNHSLFAKAPFELNMRGDLKKSEDIRTLDSRAECALCSNAFSRPEQITDKITRSEAGLSPSDEIRIISSRADVMISQIDPFNGGADCKGEINVTLLICREGEGERPRRITRKIPFNIPISFEQAAADNTRIIGFRGYGATPSVNTSIDEEGISIDTDLLLCIERCAIISFNYVKDIYSRSADCEASAAHLILFSPLQCHNKNATFSASEDLETLGLDRGLKLCDIKATVLPDINAEISDNGRIVLNGRQRITALADNGAELIPIEFESVFKYTSDSADDTPALPAISVIPTVCECKGRIDGSRLDCDTEISFAVKLDAKNQISPISEVNLTPSAINERCGACIRVCYPAVGETLWDIAKRYKVDHEYISEKNSLDPVSSPDSLSSLSKAPFLII